jgi:Mg2+ and Co2+ transporter CorA
MVEYVAGSRGSKKIKMEGVELTYKLVINSENRDVVEEMKIKDEELKRTIAKFRGDYKDSLRIILEHLENMHNYATLLEGLLRGEEYEVNSHSPYLRALRGIGKKKSQRSKRALTR